MTDKSNPVILVVDDETHILHVVRLKLENAGYAVLTAEDGGEAFDIAVSELPDFIISDYQMPFMNGLELAIALKKEEKTSKIPIMMLTARGSNIDSDQLAHTNIAMVLSKPFSPREVLALVTQAIDDSKENKTL